MPIGRMRWRVTLHVKSVDATSKVVTWPTVATLWAAVSADVPPGEHLTGGAPASTVVYAIRLRTRTDVTPAMRVGWNGKTLQIDGVRMLDPRYIELHCREVA